VSAAARARAVAAAVSVAMALSGPAHAAGNKADKRDAQKLLTQGNQLAGEGDYVAALEKFQAAYDRYPSPKILLNIGTTLRQLGRNVEAATVYETYLDDPGADPARRAEIERILAEIEAVVGRIRIEVQSPGASVRLDGKPLDEFKSGESLRVEPGEHTIVANLKGVPPAVQTVKVYPRQERLVLLRFTMPGPITAPPPPSGTQRAVALVLGGIGAAGIGVGAVFGLLAKVNNDDAATHCLQGGACDQEGVALGNTAETDATVSTISFIAGAGVLAAGVALLLTAPSAAAPSAEKPPATTALRAGAAVRADAVVLSIGGAF
jgi:hypothetical protein